LGYRGNDLRMNEHDSVVSFMLQRHQRVSKMLTLAISPTIAMTTAAIADTTMLIAPPIAEKMDPWGVWHRDEIDAVTAGDETTRHTGQ